MTSPASDRAPAAWSQAFLCSSCRRSYPETGTPYRCPYCGGIFELAGPIEYSPEEKAGPRTAGIGHYRSSFHLPEGSPFISLGEGDTPLLRIDVDARPVYFKAEFLNPTGSFKDRGTAVLVSSLVEAGVHSAVEDSSGNAGASFAAYAARAGIEARVFVPDYASGPKRQQIHAYGAEIVRVLGPRSEASNAVQRAADGGAVYASHAYLPQVLLGMATLAFELYEQLGRAPGSVILPIGQGSLLLGAHLGFKALQFAGRIDRLPRLIGVQAQACAPIWAVHSGGAAALGWVQEGETVAEGIRIIHPLRGDAVLAAIGESEGDVLAVEESDILEGQKALSRRGLYVEVTSAVVWPALQSVLADEDADPVVVVLTGSGYKQAVS